MCSAGGLTIYIQSESPGGEKESNWLLSPPEGLFTLTFRTYITFKEIIEQRWFPPPVLPGEADSPSLMIPSTA